MNTIATEIYNDVFKAMQNAEEFGAMEDNDYIELMEYIAAIATERANTRREILAQIVNTPRNFYTLLTPLKQK